MRFKRLSLAIFASAIMLAGCGKTMEEKVEEVVPAVQSTFEQDAVKTNTTEGNIALYLPEGFVIDPAEQENNFIVTSKDDQYILFVNPNESNDSQVNYNLLKEGNQDSIVKLEQLTSEDAFGFIAVKTYAEKQYEMIVSIGGIKLTTITSNKKVDEKLANMMDIVRSVEIKN